MSDDMSLDEFLNTPLGDVPEPTKLPAGTYLCTVVKHQFRDKKRGEETIKAVQLNCKINNPGDDVDPDMFAQVEAPKRMCYPEFELNDVGKKQLDNFLKKMFPGEKSGKIVDALTALPGRQVVLKVEHSLGNKPGEDGVKPIFINFKNLQPAD